MFTLLAGNLMCVCVGGGGGERWRGFGTFWYRIILSSSASLYCLS